LNLAFGFVGFTAVLSFQNAIEENAKANSKQILSADLAINARKKIAETDIQKAEDYLKSKNIQFKRTKVTEFFAMVSQGDRSHLVLVKAIDNLYPLYGELALTKSTIKRDSEKSIFNSAKIWAYPELKGILNIDVGSTLKLGSLELTIDDFINKDGTQTFRLASLAPRIFIDSAWLEKSKLLSFGSTFTEAYLYQFSVDSSASIQKDLFTVISDPAVQIDTPTTASEDSARQLGFLTDFLNLVALVAILLAGLGASYLYQVFARKKTKDFAIFKTLV
jgi:putative ABC transport system permease protein